MHVLTTYLLLYVCFATFAAIHSSVLAAVFSDASQSEQVKSIYERFNGRKPMYDYDYDDEETSGNALEGGLMYSGVLDCSGFGEVERQAGILLHYIISWVYRDDE